MDLINSQNHSKSNNSFGLIDENLMNNISLGAGFGVANNSSTADESGSSQTYRIKDKPPIPTKKTSTSKQPFGNISNSHIPTYPTQFQQPKFSQQFGENDNYNTYDEQMGDATVESVKFNDEDLAELEFSNSETEDDDDEDEDEENDENKENNFTTTNNNDLFEPKKIEIENSLFENIPKFLKHNFEYNKKEIVNETNKEQIDLFNESADILMNSRRVTAEKLEDQHINSDENRLVNLENANESIGKQNNETDVSFYNTSQNITQNERINQLVMQSVERLKRFGRNAEADLYNTTLSNHLNQNLVKPRFSSSSIHTVKSNLNNNIKSFNINNQNENEITTTAANLTTNMDSSLLLKTSFNPDLLNENQSPGFKENKFLDSKYFKTKEDECDLFEEPSFLNAKNNNPIIKVNGNQIETSQQSIQQNLFNDEFDPANQANFLGDMNDMDFKSSDEVMDMFDKDEYENKKEFELSVAINDKSTTSATNSSGPSSASSTNSGNNEKWWNNLNAQQVSKLELSNVSYLSNTLNDNNNINTTPSISKLNQQKNSNNGVNKHKIDVGDYFTRKSDMPGFLAEKVEKEDTNEETTHDNTIINETETENSSSKQVSSAVNEKSKHLESINENSITFSSPSNFNSLAAGSNFSFTLNATGDFIEDLKNKSSKPSTTTPFQLTKMLQKQQQQQQTKSTNLKAIAEDLNRVSNRLANTNLTSEDVAEDESETTKNETTTTLMIPNQKLISDPLLSSSIKSSISNSNLKILINMDETVSSISSTNIAAKKSNETTCSAANNNKQAGSLTSTPSKRNKSNNLHVIDKSSAQDSFISSIPERNDSTLVGNHHQQPIYPKSHHRHHHKHSSSTSNLNPKCKKQKNAEIQTSPSSNNNNINNNQDELNKNSRISLSSVSNSTNSSNESTANLLATQINAFNNLAASLNSNTSTNSMVASTQMVPFTFLPAGVVMKYLEEMQTSLKSNYENMSKLSANNQTETNSKLFSDTNNATPISSADSTLTTISTNKTNTSKSLNNITIPTVEFDKNSIDFGSIAEGCSYTTRMVVKLSQDSFKNIMEQKRDLNYTSYLQIEYDYINDWTIEPFDLKTNKIFAPSNSLLLKKKLNDNYTRSRFIQTLSLHNDKSTIDNKNSQNMLSDNNPDELNNILKFDLISSYYEFFVNLNTTDLNFYKEIIQKLTDQLSTQLDPILIKTNINVYYCVKAFDNNILAQNIAKKYLLNRIDLKYILGYSRLRTAANIDSIEFELDNFSFQKEEEDINEKTLLHEKTLSSINDMNCASSDLNKTLNLEKFVPLTNAGNINIDVSCFMSNNEFSNRQKLSFKNYELRLNDPLISLEAQSKLKGCVHLNLIKLYSSNFNPNNDDSAVITNMINNSNSRLIVQVKPNGLIHEIPIRIKINSDLNPVVFPPNPKENEVVKLEKPTINNNNKTNDAKIASSKTIFFFSKSLNKSNNLSGLEDEIILKNINNYDVKCCMNILNTKYFKFLSDANKNSIKLNDQMNEVQFVIYSQQQISIKVKFDYSILPHLDINNLIVNAEAKLKVNGSNKRYRFNFIGFMINDSMLNIENAVRLNEITSSTKIDECLLSRQIKLLKYNVDMMNTNYHSNRLIYRKVLNIDTKTFNTKCLLYPFIYDSRTNRQILNISKNSNDLCYDLIGMDNSVGRLRLILNDLYVNKFADLEWIEFKPEQSYQINLELILNESENMQNMYNKLDWLQIGLFWIEYDINAYCAQNLKRISSNSVPSSNANMIDSIIHKLLNNSSLINNNINMNDSIASSKSSHLSFNNDDVMSISSNLNESKAKSNNKDEPLSYLKLLRQSLKCSILKLKLKPVIIDNSLSVTNKLPDVLFSKQQQISDINNINLNSSKNESISKTPESWSIKPDILSIDKNDLVMTKVYKLELKNNLLRKPLGFDIKSNKYLSVHPTSGILEPAEKIQINVEPKISSIINFPWSGTIIIWCNKVQREVRVTIGSENDVSTVELKRDNNTLLNNISTFSMGQVSSSSTPYNHSSSAPTILSSKSTSLEQGTLGQTDITQYTITHDSIPMTPLLNTTLVSNETESIAPPTPAVKIYKTGTDSKVEFPPLTIGKQITCQLVMTNPTNSNVNWKAYSTGPVLVGPNKIQMKPGLNIFTVSPSSGVIPPLQKLSFTIVFTPKEINGEFTQTWQVDTRISETNQTEKSKDDSLIYGLAPFNCQLIIMGKCIGQTEEKFNKYKLSDRILKSKLSSTGDLTSSVLNKNHSVSSTSKLSSLIKNKETSLSSINTILTDKSYNSNTNNSNTNTISNVSSSMLSNTSSTSTISRNNRLILKNERIDFEDTQPNQISKGYLTIHNREDFDCKVRILTLNDPFFCKYTDMRVNSKHYVKVPIEFKPKYVGDFSQRMLVKVEEYDTTLSSILKGKCVNKI